MPFRAGYCAAKAGQIGLTSAMALELGPHNITVNAVAPGAVEGERFDQVVSAQAKALGVSVELIRRSIVARAPLARVTTPEDVAALVAFLCSDDARNLSGQCIPRTAGDPVS